MIAAINGARSVTSNIKCLTPIIDWKSLSIMDNAIVIDKEDENRHCPLKTRNFIVLHYM